MQTDLQQMRSLTTRKPALKTHARDRAAQFIVAFAVLIASAALLRAQTSKIPGAAEPQQAQAFSVLYAFTVADGVDSKSGLVRDKAGNLYGTTQNGGIGDGTVFKLDTAGTETVLHSFTGTDGGGPSASLVRDEEGNLYGTTVSGGASSDGTVFKLDPTGTETVLHVFRGFDGALPAASLMRDKAGNLYGTTLEGGTSGEGTVFKLDPSGTVTVLHNFTGGADGALPLSGLVRDGAGNLYGTTSYGGLPNCFGAGCGVVFKVDTTGTVTVFYSFTGRDGAWPHGDLVQDTAGNLYGTTYGGGTSGEGTVFKLDTIGTETVLYSFTGLVDGANPWTGLVRDEAGNLYGTTVQGGPTCNAASSGCGLVFKVNPAGQETILHNFTGADGANLYGSLIQDDAGNLYGTTSNGGASGYGTVFKLTQAKAATATSSISSLNPSTYGQKVTWTATVTSSGSITPTGRVNFMWDGYSIGSGTLDASGVATLTRSNLNADLYPLTAVYSGDVNNLRSTSAIVDQVVIETTSAAKITSTPSPSTLGQAVTFSATITSPTVMPTGPVTFMMGTKVLGTAQLSSGKAKFTTSTLTVGSTKVTAIYYGSSNIAKSSASVTQTVQP